MGVLDGPARSVASTLIGRFGRPLVLRRKPPQSYDPAAGGTGDAGVGPTDQLVRGIFEPAGSRPNESEEDARDSAEFKVSIAAAGIIRNEFVDRPPETGDYVVLDATTAGPADNPIVDGGTELRVVNVDHVYSGDQVALHVLGIRR